jgi:glutamate formiminotransferase/formiminotetrahydrofolate cyclodeaminase
MKELLPMIDRDTRAFDDYMSAMRMAQGTEQEKAERHRSMQEGLKTAVQVPLDVMRLADGAWDAMVEMASHGNAASRSDLEVGAKALEAGIWGASRNVAINLPGIEDEAYREEASSEADALARRAAEKRDEVLATFAGRKD